MTNVVKYLNLGKILYENSNNLQKLISKRHSYNDPRITVEDLLQKNLSPLDAVTHNTLLLMEHEPVYTTGLRDYLKPEDESKLVSLGAHYYRVDRGGLITFHGPGQLTIYPVLNLRHFKPSVRWFVCRLEECIIETCKKMGLIAGRSPHTGVWINDNKVCALGVHVSHGVTTHGLALNCNTDLKWYDHIIPCGIEGKGVTSLSKELGFNVSIDDALPFLYQSFEEVFNCKLISCSKEEQRQILEN